jgi:hypothetical protein
VITRFCEVCVPTVVNGLPAHVLLIHIVVILIPLGALFTVLSAVWPAARAKLGFISPLTCLIGLVFVPITTHAGEWLRDRLEQNGPNAAIEKHADLGDGFLPYAIGLFVVSAAVWWLGRKFEVSLRPVTERREPAPAVEGTGGGTATATRTQAAAQVQVLPQWASILLAAVAVAVGALVTWQLYRVGDSGAHASWDYVQHLGK